MEQGQRERLGSTSSLKDLFLKDKRKRLLEDDIESEAGAPLNRSSSACALSAECRGTVAEPLLLDMAGDAGSLQLVDVLRELREMRQENRAALESLTATFNRANAETKKEIASFREELVKKDETWT